MKRTLPLLCLLLLLAACRSNDPTPLPPGEAAMQARVRLTGTGLFSVGADALASLGWSADDPIRLTFQGDALPYQRADGALFFVLPDDTPSRYSAEQVLWMTRAGEATAATPTEGGAGEALPTVQAVQRLTEQKEYSPKHLGDPWFWRKMIWNTTTTERLATPGRSEGDVRVTVRGAGVTQVAHRVEVQVNGTAAGTMAWEGDERHEASFTVALPAGDTLEVTLVVPNTQGDMSMLDELIVQYPAAPRLSDGRFEGMSASGGTARFDGLGADGIAWQLAPTVQPLRVAEGGVALPAGQPVLVSARSRAQPTSVEAVGDTALPTAGADYVAIAPAALHGALEPLLAFHREEGLTTTLLTPQQLYDGYSFGAVDPLAIRAMLADAQATWERKPRFVLLVGDSSYDPAGYQSELPPAYLPSPFVETVFGGETVSDNVLADVDEDGYPDVALGRLPARTAEQVDTIVNKILAYSRSPEEGAWRQRVLLTADGQEALFQQNSEKLRADLPASVQADTVYPAAQSDAMALMLPALNEGSFLVNYVGHGSVQQWGRDQILTAQAVAELSNGARLPIYINMTCLTGLFSHPTQESLGEALLWTPAGGAIATVAPSSLTLPNDQSALNEALVLALLSPERPTLGEALMEAKRTVPLTNANGHDIVATFNLLGDPAMRPAPLGN